MNSPFSSANRQINLVIPKNLRNFAANMKKICIIITLSALLLTACGGSNGGGIFGGSSIDIEEAKTTKVVTITNEDNAPQCQVSL